MSEALQRASEALGEAASKIRELLEDAERKQRADAAELKRMAAAHGIPIYLSSNLPPTGVSILIGEELWKIMRDEKEPGTETPE
jgi:hypothetical protein